MKNYILGHYASSDHLLETLANKKRRKMLNALLSSHPSPMKIREIASKGKVSEKTTRGGTYLRRLEEDGFVKEVDEETGGLRYVFEDVNSLTRKRHAKYYLAPGNVEYDEGFKSSLDRLIVQTEVKTKFRALLEFVTHIVESVKVSDEKQQSDEEKIGPKEDVCSICGLNHEARDFIRATLLYLLDQFERSPDYLEFLKQRYYIDKTHYNEYYKIVETNLGQQISKGLGETQITGPKISEEQIVTEAATSEVLMTEERITHPKTGDEREANHWFKKLKPVVKEMVEFLREAKQMSMWQTMNSIREFMNDHELRSYPEAVYGVIESFGISRNIPDPLFERYLHSKRKRDEKRRRSAKPQKN